MNDVRKFPSLAAIFHLERIGRKWRDRLVCPVPPCLEGLAAYEKLSPDDTLQRL